MLSKVLGLADPIISYINKTAELEQQKELSEEDKKARKAELELTLSQELNIFEKSFINSETVRQDEQTDWVQSLVKVCETCSEEFGEKEILIVKRCLRPYKYEQAGENEDNNQWENFTNLSIDQLNMYFKENPVKKLSWEQKNIIRQVASILLKYHWESFEVKVGSKSEEESNDSLRKIFEEFKKEVGEKSIDYTENSNDKYRIE